MSKNATPVALQGEYYMTTKDEAVTENKERPPCMTLMPKKSGVAYAPLATPLPCPCHSPYVLPGVVCHKRIVPSSVKKRTSVITNNNVAPSLTTSRGVHFAVRAVHDSVNRSMMALVQFHFAAVDKTVDPDPWITDRTGDEAISSRWMQRSRGRGVRECKTVRGRG